MTTDETLDVLVFPSEPRPQVQAAQPLTLEQDVELARETLGQVAYQGYCAASGGKSLVSGAPLPAWSALSPEIRTAWRTAAAHVVGGAAEVLGEIVSSVFPR